MAELMAEFEGVEADRPVRILLYESHLEVAVEDDGGPVAIRIPLEEVGAIEARELLGIPVLVIEDTSGTQVASVRMSDADAARAAALVDRLRTA